MLIQHLIRNIQCSRIQTLFHLPSRSASYSSTLSDLFYNEEQKELQKSLRKIIENDINPFVEEWEAAEEFPSHQVFKKLGAAGLLGVQKPKEYGGLGLSYKYQAGVLEELGLITCGGIPFAIGVHTDIATPGLANFGSVQLKKDYLVPAVTGDAVCCLAVSEPGAGSDVAGVKTSAVRDGDDLVISGEKIWITNGLKADWICLLANTSSGKPHKNKSLIVVPTTAKGITRTKMKKMGLRCCDTAFIKFDNVRVPFSNIIGEEGKGFAYQMIQFHEDRLCAALLFLKEADQLIGATFDYTSQRKAIGSSSIDSQVLQFRLAEIATEVEALRALTYQAVELRCEDQNFALIATLAKLKTGVLARKVTNICLHLWGETGCAAESLVSRFYRDLRIISIGGGSDEISLEIICKIAGINSRKLNLCCGENAAFYTYFR